MANTRGSSSHEEASAKHGSGMGLGYEREDWAEPEAAPRDWKKIVLVVGLGALSWVATYVGMLELIQANMGELPLTYKLITAFSVAMLMTMIIWLLDQLFSPINFATKLTYVAGYIFLTLISVGFGFGFYWKVLESKSEATRSAESAVGQVQNALHAGSTRMEQLNVTLKQLTELSANKAIEEREKGTSCPNSSPGDGPRRKLRDDDAQRFTFASDFVGSRIGTVRSDLTALDGDLAKITSRDASTVDEATGTRNEFMRGLGRRLDMTVTGFNAFRTDPQLRQIRADLADRAEKTIFPTSGGGTFACPDPQLQAALRGVVRAIDQLPELSKPEIAAVEGSEATIEAFRRLTASLAGVLVLDLPPSADELRELQKKAVQSVDSSGTPVAQATVQAGLSKRDYIPLAIAVFVDLCLLLVSMGRPMNRLNNLVPKMRAAERGPVIRILSRFNDIHRDPEIRQNFEVFRHVVFDYHGAYYVAVPLDTPYNRIDPRTGRAAFYGANDAQDLQHEAHLLSNLFTSFEQEKIFARVYSPLLSTRMIQKRLARQGSKFAGSQAFRVYRFREGAWSDIILGAVMGAARRVEDEKRRRAALEERQLAERGPILDAPIPPREQPQRPAFETGVPANDRTGEQAKRSGVGTAASMSAISARVAGQTNGPNGTNGAKGQRSNSHSAFDGFDARRAAALNDTEDTQMNHRDARPDEKDRSQFGAYAYAARAELNGSGHGAEEHHHLSDDVSDDTKDQSGDQSGFDVAFANNNTAPSRRGDSDVVILPAAANGGPESSRAAANGSLSGYMNGSMNGSAANVEAARVALKSAKTAVSEANVIALPFADPLYGNGARPDISRDQGRHEGLGGQTTVTMTRETATFTLPASEATLPAALLAAAGAKTSVRPAVDALSAKDAAGPSKPVAKATLVPPPLPTQSVAALTPPPLPTSAATTAGAEAADAVPEFAAQGGPKGKLEFSSEFDDDEFDVFYTIHEEDEEATRSIAHRLKPASRA